MREWQEREGEEESERGWGIDRRERKYKMYSRKDRLI
jgi:hypothetical protein